MGTGWVGGCVQKPAVIATGAVSAATAASRKIPAASRTVPATPEEKAATTPEALPQPVKRFSYRGVDIIATPRRNTYLYTATCLFPQCSQSACPAPADQRSAVPPGYRHRRLRSGGAVRRSGHGPGRLPVLEGVRGHFLSARWRGRAYPLYGALDGSAPGVRLLQGG